MDILEIVKERPMKESEPACPYCGSTKLGASNISTTLLGGPPDGPDPNHQWNRTSCTACKRKFTREEKRGNVWYVDPEGVVLKGIPTCFEGYIYHCAKCDGPVHRENKALDGGELPSFELEGERKENILSVKLGPGGKREKQYRVFYRCQKCDHGGEVEDDYYRAECWWLCCFFSSLGT